MSIFNLERLSLLAQVFGIGRGVDFVIYLSLIALFYFVYSLMVKNKQLQESVTKIVRELAVRESDSKCSKSNRKAKKASHRQTKR